MASIVATPDPTTGSVLVQVDPHLVFDTFNRVVAPGSWGSASDIGGAYTILGPSLLSFQVNGTDGQMTTTSTGAAYRAWLLSGLTDMDAKVQVFLGVNPTVQPIDGGIMLRYGLAETYYQARVRFSPGGVEVTYSIQHVNGATRTALTPEIPIPGFLVSASTDVGLRATISGDLIRVRAWRVGDAEPQDWPAQARNTEFTSGAVGLQAWRNSGNTNAGAVVNFEDFSVTASVEPLNLWRHTPDGEVSLVRGSGFFVDTYPQTATFWDNEAPFDTDIFYTLRSSDSTTDTVTSNTVSLASGGDAWLRDPYNPSNNIVIEISDDPFDYCDETPRVMFADLQSKVYDSASGIFDLIDAQRPETIAQLRKRYGSTLFLTSKESADVDAIEAIIAGGYPLLLSLPPVYQFGNPYGTDWVTFLAVQSDPPGVDRRLPTRNWIMPFRLSLPASDTDTGSTGGNGIGGGDATYDILAASALGLTYNSLTAAATTYNAVAAGTGY